MGKLILIIAGVLFALWLLRRIQTSHKRGPAPPPAVPEDMVRCAQCGVHLPRSESHEASGQYFCSEEHLRLRR